MRLFALVFVLASSAFAQPIGSLHDEQWVHTRVSLLAGGALRGFQQITVDAVETKISPRGVVAPSGQLLGVVFFRPWLGAGLEVRSDFSKVQRQVNGQLTGDPIEQFGLKTYATAAFRWQPSLLFSVEGHAGFVLARSTLLSTSTGTAVSTGLFGVVGGANLLLEPLAQLTILAGGRIDYTFASAQTLGFSLTAQLRWGFVELGPFTLGLAVTGDYSVLGYGRSAVVTSATESVLRFGIGPSLVGRREAPPGAEKPLAEAPSVVGKVTRVDGGSIAGAKVTVGAVTVTSDASGAFEVVGLRAGPASVKATANGFKAASRDIVVTPGTPVIVTLVLPVPTGPGRITGVVKSKADKPLAGAKVVMGAVNVLTSATGTYALEPAGPGPVKVVVSLDGYAIADESVQVVPESTATLDVTLEPLAQRTKAKIRGVISSAAGPVAKATVRIVELKLKQAVKADGRFEADVAGGKYTLVIEAPKHVTQTRLVEVADGDQAIFQIELEKAR
ncbi:MAG: carboxypeptidase regulatory-like domain-containing protein [Archangium sp.]|nr:carboxypeptidase regulatory-like domain-containing protein [Archangium sp.]